MATRTKTTTDNGDILKNLFGGSTKEMPVDLNDLRSYTKLSIMEAVSLFVDMEESGLIETSGRGENMVGWVKGDKPSAPAAEVKPKRTRRTKAEMEAARAAEHAKVAYNAARDFELDALSNGATPEEAAKARTSVAEELSDTEPTETVNEPEKVRPEPQRAVLAAHILALKLRHAEASNLRDGYVAPEEVTTLPERPHGVSENFWDMAHNAYGPSERDTLSAQMFWWGKCAEQHDKAMHDAFAEALDAS